MRLIEKKILRVLCNKSMSDDDLYLSSFGNFMGYSKDSFTILLCKLEEQGFICSYLNSNTRHWYIKDNNNEI